MLPHKCNLDFFRRAAWKTAKNHPEWITWGRDSKGKKVPFLDPAKRPEQKKRNAKIIGLPKFPGLPPWLKSKIKTKKKKITMEYLRKKIKNNSELRKLLNEIKKQIQLV